MTSKIIPVSVILLNLERVERKGRNYKNLNISRTKSFFDEITRSKTAVNHPAFKRPRVGHWSNQKLFNCYQHSKNQLNS